VCKDVVAFCVIADLWISGCPGILKANMLHFLYFIWYSFARWQHNCINTVVRYCASLALINLFLFVWFCFCDFIDALCFVNRDSESETWSFDCMKSSYQLWCKDSHDIDRLRRFFLRSDVINSLMYTSELGTMLHRQTTNRRSRPLLWDTWHIPLLGKISETGTNPYSWPYPTRGVISCLLISGQILSNYRQWSPREISQRRDYLCVPSRPVCSHTAQKLLTMIHTYK